MGRRMVTHIRRVHTTPVWWVQSTGHMWYWMSGALHITCTNDGGFSFVLQRASRNKGGLQLYQFFSFLSSCTNYKVVYSTPFIIPHETSFLVCFPPHSHFLCPCLRGPNPPHAHLVLHHHLVFSFHFHFHH